MLHRQVQNFLNTSRTDADEQKRSKNTAKCDLFTPVEGIKISETNEDLKRQTIIHKG